MFFRIAVLVALVFAGGPASAEVPTAVLEAQAERAALVRRISPSVVCVFGRDGGGGGSGVLISPDGLALTNFHVTSGAGDFMKCGLDDGKLYDALIVGIDPTGDVAMIKLIGRDDFPHAPLGDSDALEVGEWVYVVGNPFLLASDFTPTVTYGIVSGLHRYQYPAGTFLEYSDCIQFDTSLNPGNSGGPLFNERGEVVGINGRGSFEKRGRVNVGAGYAISINQVKHFLDHLRSGRVVDHGSVGATVSTGPDGAVRVRSILEESDAYRRGLRSGDEIVSFAGRPIRSANQFQNALGIHPEGRMLPLTYRRGAETFDVVVRLSGAHRESELLEFSETPPDRGNPQPGRPEGPEGKPGEDAPGGPEPEGSTGGDVLAELRSLFVKKPGFANYYFNEIEQRRVLDRLGRYGIGRLAGPVELSGISTDKRPFRMIVASEDVGFTLGDRSFLQPLKPDAELLDEPAGSGGLLGAAYLVRAALSEQRGRLAAFYYHGSEPLDATGPAVDVLIAEDRGGMLRLYVTRADGRLAGFDFRRTDAAEECRVRFGDDEVAADGVTVPKEWRVAYGDREFVTLLVEKVATRRATAAR